MKLTILERLNIKTLLPAQGNFETLIISQDIAKKVTITQEEVKEYEMKTEAENIVWNEKGVTSEKEIEFTDAEKLKISEFIQKKNSENALTESHISLYKKFISNPPEEGKEVEL